MYKNLLPQSLVLFLLLKLLRRANLNTVLQWTSHVASMKVELATDSQIQMTAIGKEGCSKSVQKQAERKYG